MAFRSAGRVVPFDDIAKQMGWLVKATNRGLMLKAAQDGKDVAKAPQVAWKHNGRRMR